MAAPKEKHRAIIEGYFYSCCPYCKNTLIQGKNGTDCFSRCPTCGEYIHIVIASDCVLTKKAETN